MECRAIDETDAAISPRPHLQPRLIPTLQSSAQLNVIKIPFWKGRFVGTGFVEKLHMSTSEPTKSPHDAPVDRKRKLKLSQRFYQAWCQTQECIDHMVNWEHTHPEPIGNFGR